MTLEIVKLSLGLEPMLPGLRVFFLSRPEGTVLHRVWKTRCVEKITLILGEAMGTVVAPTPQSGQPLVGMVPYPAFLVAGLQRT